MDVVTDVSRRGQAARGARRAVEVGKETTMTKTTHPTLGNGLAVDVQSLIASRLLVQANSGGGKSYAIRKLLEITYGACQHIVLDIEGEFHTLREKFDYALAGKGGEGPADIKSAAMLARRLLELNVSCIIDIYELGTQRALFVKRFLEALVDSPRSLWHPAIVVVDEAQKFCPETSKAESAAAVENLMTLGRKRGFAGVLATQRISDLSKSAAAECNNMLIGRCGLDVDQARAGKALGFTKREDVLGLRDPAGRGSRRLPCFRSRSLDHRRDAGSDRRFALWPPPYAIHSTTQITRWASSSSLVPERSAPSSVSR